MGGHGGSVQRRRAQRQKFGRGSGFREQEFRAKGPSSGEATHTSTVCTLMMLTLMGCWGTAVPWFACPQAVCVCMGAVVTPTRVLRCTCGVCVVAQVGNADRLFTSTSQLQQGR